MSDYIPLYGDGHTANNSTPDDRYTEVDAAWWIDHVLASHATQLGPLVEAIQSGAGEGPFYTQPLALRYHPNPMSGSETGVKDKKGLPPLSTLGLSAGDYVGNLHFWPNTPIDGGEPAMIDRPREEQVWVAAWDVLPLLQGRGVGRTMLNAGLEAWIGWMGVGKVLAVSAVSFLPIFECRKGGSRGGTKLVSRETEGKLVNSTR